jgi:hypothetical protein
MGKGRFPYGIMTGVHPLDVVAAWLTCRQKLFSRGWGDELLLRDLFQCASFAQPLGPICIDWSARDRQARKIQRDGAFRSPLDLLPSKARTAHVRAWLKNGNTAACVILAASRDEGLNVARDATLAPMCLLSLQWFLNCLIASRSISDRYGSRKRVCKLSFRSLIGQGISSGVPTLVGRYASQKRGVAKVLRSEEEVRK